LIGVADSHTVIRGQWLLGMSIGSISFQVDQFLAFRGRVLKHFLRFVQASSNLCGHVDSRIDGQGIFRFKLKLCEEPTAPT
jgi:hypothetical protein